MGNRLSATTAKRRASWRATGRLRSRRNTLVETRRAPASRQTRAAAFSNENPRPQSTPNRGHADCGGQKSRRRPQWHMREDRSKTEEHAENLAETKIGEGSTAVNGVPDTVPTSTCRGPALWETSAARMALEEKTFFNCTCCEERPTVVKHATAKGGDSTAAGETAFRLDEANMWHLCQNSGANLAIAYFQGRVLTTQIREKKKNQRTCDVVDIKWHRCTRCDLRCYHTGTCTVCNGQNMCFCMTTQNEDSELFYM